MLVVCVCVVLVVAWKRSGRESVSDSVLVRAYTQDNSPGREVGGGGWVGWEKLGGCDGVGRRGDASVKCTVLSITVRMRETLLSQPYTRVIQTRLKCCGRHWHEGCGDGGTGWRSGVSCVWTGTHMLVFGESYRKAHDA